MNNLVKEELRENRDTVRTLELKKDNLKDKVEMQKNFIGELETRADKAFANINEVKG